MEETLTLLTPWPYVSSRFHECRHIKKLHFWETTNASNIVYGFLLAVKLPYKSTCVGGWIVALQKRYFHPQNVALFGISIFADIINVRISRWGHPVLGKALNPMTGIPTGENRRPTGTQRRPCDDGVRDESYGVTNKATHCINRCSKGKEGFSSRELEAAQSCQHLHFTLLVSKTWENAFLLF